MPFLVIFFLLLLEQEHRPGQALVWKFTQGQEFFVEENHRQLYQVKVGVDRVSSYLDYSLLQRYQVKSVRAQEVMLETTLERVRINNPNEAGREAIDVLKKQEGSRQKWRLRKKDDLWRLKAEEHPAQPGTVFSTLLLTLGTPAFEAAQPTWQQNWQMPVAELGKAKLVMNCQAKTTENPPRIRAEVRPEFQWDVTKGSSTVQVQDIPSSTPGLAFFDVSRGRWYYLDFRVTAKFQAQQGARAVEIRQDFSVIYLVSDNRPPWQ